MVGSKWSSSWNSSSTSSELESSFRFGTEEGGKFGTGLAGKAGTGWEGRGGGGFDSAGGVCCLILLLLADGLTRELFDGKVGLELGLASRGFAGSAGLGMLAGGGGCMLGLELGLASRGFDGSTGMLAGGGGCMLGPGSGEFVGVKSGASDDSGEDMEM